MAVPPPSDSPVLDSDVSLKSSSALLSTPLHISRVFPRKRPFVEIISEVDAKPEPPVKLREFSVLSYNVSC